MCVLARRTTRVLRATILTAGMLAIALIGPLEILGRRW
jgi:hypothetical protein